jgi:hypothetical protein
MLSATLQFILPVSACSSGERSQHKLDNIYYYYYYYY